MLPNTKPKLGRPFSAVPRKTITLRLPPDLDQAIEMEAARTGSTKTEVVENAIRSHLRRSKLDAPAVKSE